MLSVVEIERGLTGPLAGSTTVRTHTMSVEHESSVEQSTLLQMQTDKAMAVDDTNQEPEAELAMTDHHSTVQEEDDMVDGSRGPFDAIIEPGTNAPSGKLRVWLESLAPQHVLMALQVQDASFLGALLRQATPRPVSSKDPEMSPYTTGTFLRG